MPLRIPYICAPCLRRGYASSVNTTPPHPPSIGFSRLSESRSLIEIHGRDAAKYLQGLTTRNIPMLSDGRGAYSAFLNAQGKVLYDVFIYPTNHNIHWRNQIELKNHQPKYQPPAKKGPTVEEPGFFIECDKRSAETLHHHLRRYKISSKFHSRIIPDREWGVWAIWDDHRLLKSEPAEIGCTDSRAPNLGKRVVVYDSAKLGPETDVSLYNLRRMLHGVPEGQQEILHGGNIAQESNMDFMGGVDFRKGCYVGQELTIRTHHTGVVRKRVLPVQFYRPDDPVPEELTYNPNLNLAPTPTSTNPDISKVDGKGRAAGKLLKGVGNIGLALCRLEVMTNLEIEKPREDKTVPAFRLNVKGEELRVKAFVPGWHLLGNTTTTWKAPVTTPEVEID